MSDDRERRPEDAPPVNPVAGRVGQSEKRPLSEENLSEEPRVSPSPLALERTQAGGTPPAVRADDPISHSPSVPQSPSVPHSPSVSHSSSQRDLRPSLPVTPGPSRVKKVLLWASGILLVCAIGLVVTVLLVVQHFSRDLPDTRQLEKGYAPPQVTRVLARDGTLLANLFLERRTVVPIEKIPDHVKSAFLAAEDAAFFEHEGLDYFGMLRAMVANVRAGTVKQGGSTITQQVVKNVLLDHERSYRRKIRETILAYRLEQTLTKEQILGMYMNHAYLGHGRYGVEEAAVYYFGKHVDAISVAEAALLSGIVAAPERFSPRKDEKKALMRRAYVLGQMLEKGFMTKSVYDGSLAAPVRLAPTEETESDIAPEMVGHTQRMLRALVGEQARAGGFTVRTTIDPALQVAARTAVRAGLDDYLKRQKLKPPFTLEDRRLWGKAFEGKPRRHGIYVGKVVSRDDKKRTIGVQVGDVVGVVDLRKEERYNPTHLSPSEFVGPSAALRVRVVDAPEDATKDAPVRLELELGPQGALIALDPRTREVLAAVGNYEARAGALDRTVQSKRQPGSTFKPLVYSYALDTHQVTAATRFALVPTKEELEQLRKSATSLDPESGAPGSEVPSTVSLSLRQGVARSDNRVAIEVFRMVGGRQAVQWAQALGIESKLGPDESLMLGSYELTVAELAGAFSVFASGGTVLSPTFITSIESGAGPLTLPARLPERRVIDPEVAYLTTNILESVIKEGTGKRAGKLGRPLAGKTGTTNRAKDAWFVGYSTDLVVAVWVGFDDALPLGWGESGATAALPIWMEFMESAHKGKPATQFPRPDGIQELLIDPSTGLLARYGQEDAVSEIFLPGTGPTETAPELEEAPLLPEEPAPLEDLPAPPIAPEDHEPPLEPDSHTPPEPIPPPPPPF